MMRDRDKDSAKLQRLNRLHPLFSKMPVWGFVALVVMAIPLLVVPDVFAETPYLPIMCLVVFGLVIVGAVGQNLVERSAKKLASAYTPAVLERVLDRLDEYDRGASVNHSYLHENLAFPDFDRVGKYGDYVKGVFRGVPVQFSEFVLQKEVWERDDDEDGGYTRSWHEVFQGLILVSTHTLSLTDGVSINGYATYADSVKTTREDFNHLYSVAANNPNDAALVLTASRVKGLVDIHASMGIGLCLCLVPDGKLIVVARGMDLLEAGESHSTEELVAHLEGGLERLGTVIDLLELRELTRS